MIGLLVEQKIQNKPPNLFVYPEALETMTPRVSNVLAEIAPTHVCKKLRSIKNIASHGSLAASAFQHLNRNNKFSSENKNKIRFIIDNLYRRGPSFLGMHEGIPPQEICAKISATSHLVWTNNQYECELMIERRVDSFVAVLTTFLAIYLFMGVSTLALSTTRQLLLILIRKNLGGVFVEPSREFRRVPLDCS